MPCPLIARRNCEDLRAIHAVWPTVFYYEPEPSVAKLQGMRRVGENELPLVWKHDSGRASLVLGCTTLNIVGKTPFESAEIIHGLREWARSRSSATATHGTKAIW